MANFFGKLASPQGAIAMQLLSNSGPSLTPNNTFQGMPQLLQTIQQQKAAQKQQQFDNDYQSKMLGLQMEENARAQSKADWERAQAVAKANQENVYKNKTRQVLQKAGRQDLIDYLDATGDGAGALEALQAKPDLPSSVQEFEYGQQNPDYNDWRLAGKKAGASQTNISMGDNAFDKKIAEGSAGMFVELGEQYNSAQTAGAQIDRLESLLGQFDSGGGAQLQKMAGDFGIKTEGLDEIQAAQAIINKMVPDQRVPGSGPMSDADLELFKQSLPRIINQPGGNQLIINTLRGINEYQKMQGEIGYKVMAGEITRADAIQALRSLPNPLDRLTKAMNKTGVDRKSQLHSKYGLE